MVHQQCIAFHCILRLLWHENSSNTSLWSFQKLLPCIQQVVAGNPKSNNKSHFRSPYSFKSIRPRGQDGIILCSVYVKIYPLIKLWWLTNNTLASHHNTLQHVIHITKPFWKGDNKKINDLSSKFIQSLMLRMHTVMLVTISSQYILPSSFTYHANHCTECLSAISWQVRW